MPNDFEPRVVSLIDVAHHAGVSRATASLVLRDSPLVARQTRERVLDAVEKLGYVYNRRAANLRGRRTKTIGLVVSDIANPFFAELTIGVDAALDAAGYVPFLANTGESLARQERFLKRMREQDVDGILLCPVAGSSEDVLRKFSEVRMPCVQALRFISATEGDYVGPDFELGIAQVAEHLIRLGHRRIALIGGDQAHSVTLARRAGFISAMRRHRLRADLIIKVPPTRQAGFAAVQGMLAQPEPPTAAICANDVVAFGVTAGLKAAGVRPGLDFAVTGVDDVPEAALSDPSLTTISTAARQLGEAAAQLLLRRIENPRGPPERILFPTRLMVRRSCGPQLASARTQAIAGV